MTRKRAATASAEQRARRQSGTQRRVTAVSVRLSVDDYLRLERMRLPGETLSDCMRRLLFRVAPRAVE